MVQRRSRMIGLVALIAAVLMAGCGDGDMSNGAAQAPSANLQADETPAESDGNSVSMASPWVSSDGTEYMILAIGEMRFLPENDRMRTIKYLSRDPKDAAVREKEFADLYVLAARNLKLEGFDLVGLIAVDKPPRPGIQMVSGYRDMRPVSEVMELAQQ